MIEPPGYIVRIERTFDAPREAVFDAWTSPEGLSQVGPAEIKKVVGIYAALGRSRASFAPMHLYAAPQDVGFRLWYPIGTIGRFEAL